jgi:hypothetical protein
MSSIKKQKHKEFRLNRSPRSYAIVAAPLSGLRISNHQLISVDYLIQDRQVSLLFHNKEKNTMRKTIILLMVLIALTINSTAQIPNNGFEDWRTVGNCIEPVNWYSFYSLFDSAGNYCPVTRSTDHYPESIGTYSVRIANDTTIWNSGEEPGSFLGWGMLLSTRLDDRPLFPLTGHPTSLCGYYKFLPQNGDTMNINIYLYHNGSEVSNGHLRSGASTSDWISFNLEFSSYEIADSARITLSASIEPKDGSGVKGNSVLYVDNLSFDVLISSLAEQIADKMPGTFVLDQNYPNPFNPSTTISFNLPERSFVSLKLFDLTGREVTTLVAAELPAGHQTIQWNAADMTSGVYFYHLQAGTHNATKKLVLIK